MVENIITITPKIFSFQTMDEVEDFISTHSHHHEIVIYDTIIEQLSELIKCRFPEKRFDKETLSQKVSTFLEGTNPVSYGVWVFYPWNRTLIHLLPEKEFIELRTNRNQYKISPNEQNHLSKKIVGVIGLSVGQSVALTMAMERSFGEIRLADFDTLDLSNLNRLRGKVSQIGLAKTLICAREILELDPFLKVKVFNEGIHEGNIDEFFTKDGKLDLLIEECDGLDIKILSRYKAREYGVPVLMETSDRGLLDIERFDLEPKRQILHGLVGDLDPAKLKGLSQEDKIEYLLPMVGLNSLSERMKASMIEVQSSIVSWPQLASAVTMGGGVAAEMSRKILLNNSSVSGRFYIDLDELVPEPKSIEKTVFIEEIKSPLTIEDIQKIVKESGVIARKDYLNEMDKKYLIEAASMAPSGGNTQPWRFGFYEGNLFFIHDIFHSQSFLDFANLGSYIGFGAAIENIRVQAAVLGYRIKHQYFPNTNDSRLVAICSFEPSDEKAEVSLSKAIFDRHTNRKIGSRQELSNELKERFSIIRSEEPNAHLTIIEDMDKMNELGELVSSAEMLLLLHPQGHHDMFTKELRMTTKEALDTRDGLDVATLNFSKAEILALRIASSRKAIEWVERIGGGEAFKKNTKKGIANASAMGIVSMPFYSNESYLHAGEFVQKIWLESTRAGFSFQPITQYSFLIARLIHGNGEGFTENYIRKFNDLNNRFKLILPELATREINFIFRLAKEKDAEVRSLRRPIDKLLFNIN
ncbi:MAG: hypothetical protein CFE21_07385 [Bacteroidetes bacterium B1(2017)]|nr:MAG: hypothetical protein CFE21_07385 [Bacteroidetes bacterium B1(2017)]